MKKTAFKIFLFFSPFIFISLFVFIVDPYNLFNISHIFTDDAKFKCLNRSPAVVPRGNTVWRIVKFKRKPSPNIILGDSRIMDISIPLMEKRFGDEITNLAIPASNLRTIIELFWMASDMLKLENVIIQINFNRYNSSINFDMLRPVKQLFDKPYNYFFNWNYVKDAFCVFYYSITQNEQIVKPAELSDQERWEISKKSIDYDLSVLKYIYPKNYYYELIKISDYCNKENINLIFVIAPNYIKVHDMVKNYDLEDEYMQFKEDINSLGQTIDLDDGRPFTFNKDNYSDHLHLKPHLMDTLVSMVFTDGSTVYKR